MRCALAMVVILAACGGKKDDSSATGNEPHKLTTAELVARGKYLAALGGCGGCHEADYAGGLEVPEPFGTWRSPNITPDEATGIGTWSDDQILQGIREGVRPDGSHMYPIMPYLLYNRLTDSDGRALVAFLRALPAVGRTSPPNQLELPQPHAAIPANEPDFTDDPYRHGEYLAAVMLCSHCHATPGGDPSKAFAGGMKLDGVVAPNITSDRATGIGTWTEEQIAQALQTMTRPDGRVIQGPMQLMLTGWSQMTAPDRGAVAAYIHQLPPVKNPVQASTLPPATPAH
nr:c-type cytochrome [Kofleriaceae bacterium]